MTARKPLTHPAAYDADAMERALDAAFRAVLPGYTPAPAYPLPVWPYEERW